MAITAEHSVPEPGELVRLISLQGWHTELCKRYIAFAADFKAGTLTDKRETCDCWVGRALDLARSQEAALIGLADLSESQEQRIRELEEKLGKCEDWYGEEISLREETIKGLEQQPRESQS